MLGMPGGPGIKGAFGIPVKLVIIGALGILYLLLIPKILGAFGIFGGLGIRVGA